MSSADATPRRFGLAALAGMQTGAKVFLILFGAMLPLAVPTFFATLQTTRAASQDVAARLRVAVDESAHALSGEIGADLATLRLAMATIDAGGAADPAGPCARIDGAMQRLVDQGVQYEIVDAGGTVRCRTPAADQVAIRPLKRAASTPRFIDGRGLAVDVAAGSDGLSGAIFYPTALLARIAKPSGYSLPRAVALELNGDTLPLEDIDERTLVGTQTQHQPLGLGTLGLRVSIPNAPITSPIILALLLPIVMWIAAAAVAWFVVDRLLIRPMQELRAAVAAYRPGEIIDPGQVRSLPAQELRELGDTFRAITRTVALHEAELAAGLDRQTKLTREVHHRVKNNLQVITSLINFHARGAKGPEASAAYASIQRRVDALAVVHRHHFAEMEEHRGLGLRAVIGELAANIRATAPENRSLQIALEIEPFLVNQDVAVAVAFLVTELVELASSVADRAAVRISLRVAEKEDRAMLRVSSPQLVDGDALRDGLEHRFGRVIEGLSRQLRSRLHHDPLVGAYEIEIAVLGRD